MRRIGAVLTALAIVYLAACGGDDETPSGPQRAAQSPSPSPSPSESPDGDIEVEVEGRTLTGHCSGESGPGNPTVILDSGMKGGQGQLAPIEYELVSKMRVCGYDRAGNGSSDPASDLPRSLTDLVTDLEGFLEGAQIEPPYFLVGQSLGGNVAFMYAQAHPEDVQGFVSMNPVPPHTVWLREVKKVQTRIEFQAEVDFDKGLNEEQVRTDDTDKMFSDPLPDSMPYAVMFAEDFGGNTEFGGRVLKPLTEVTKRLATVGKGGRFIWIKDAGHDIYATHLPQVMRVINQLLDV